MASEAIDLFLQMEECKVEPDAFKSTSILPTCGDISALLLGMRIHRHIEKKKLRPNLLVENALMDIHSGLLDEGKYYYKLMIKEHRIIPRIAHLACMVDLSRPQSKEIYEELDVLVGKMKELGYVPENDSALHDVEEEEDKECYLAVHTEKLVVVFAILNSKPSTTIRITKNLRVYGDFHTTAKLISKIAKREIVVRDTNHFNHFKDGFWSCGDYW
ncbi:hypothetical protein UlMin_025034 [Ulmus minor]